MKVCSGQSILDGIAIGKLFLYEKKEYGYRPEHTEDPWGEEKRFEEAVKQAKEQLIRLYEIADEKLGKEQAAIFEAQKMILEDEEFLGQVTGEIREKRMTAESAAVSVGEWFAAVLEKLEDPYMKGRGADVREVAGRIRGILLGETENLEEAILLEEEPVILLASDLTPAQTMYLDKDRVLAFVTQRGTLTSHTAILARSLQIPALVGTKVEPDRQYHGCLAVVDGMTGQLLIDPDEETLQKMVLQKRKYREQMEEQLRRLHLHRELFWKGKRIKVCANIQQPTEAAEALLAHADGIGLFRSELLYLNRESDPDEEEQYLAYREVVKQMQGKPVVIRTLDMGADKQAAYLELPWEENPAMGYRAIRICLDRPDMFKTQLRAILRAAAHGNVSVLFPMITSTEEVIRCKELLFEARTKLEAEGKECGNVRIGVMIETPAAVMISDELAEQVEFFSIGTNDLTQYTLAIDRQNPNLHRFYDAHHPAVLRMIRMTVENARKKGIPVGICGELAADLTLTQTLLDMGVEELSVSLGMIWKLKSAIMDA